MAKKNITYEIKMGAPEYMNTYGDMMTLLLCFFVLLFAMSNVDAKKFEALVVSFSGSLGVLDGGNILQSESNIDQGAIGKGSTASMTESNNFDKEKEKNSTPEEQAKQAKEQAMKAAQAKVENENFEKLQKQIEEYLKQNKLEDAVSVANEQDGLILRFQDNIFFDPGSATLKTGSFTVLKYVGGLLKTPQFKDRNISVEGHTDNVPMSNYKYESNWELSGGRASSVVRYLVENQGIDPKRLSAAGYSEYHPVAKNDTAQNRAKNRRVDIMILKSRETRNIR